MTRSACKIKTSHKLQNLLRAVRKPEPNSKYQLALINREYMKLTDNRWKWRTGRIIENNNSKFAIHNSAKQRK